MAANHHMLARVSIWGLRINEIGGKNKATQKLLVSATVQCR